MRREADLIEIEGTPLSRRQQKGKQKQREWQRDHFYIKEAVMGQQVDLGGRHLDKEPSQKRTPLIWA